VVVLRWNKKSLWIEWPCAKGGTEH
jgi:hypothetical protein